VFRGIGMARDEATHTTQKLRVYCKSTLAKKVVMCGPVLAWSKRHLSDCFHTSREGDVVWKLGQV
jgi:hypothetical protein